MPFLYFCFCLHFIPKLHLLPRSLRPTPISFCIRLTLSLKTSLLNISNTASWIWTNFRWAVTARCEVAVKLAYIKSSFQLDWMTQGRSKHSRYYRRWLRCHCMAEQVSGQITFSLHYSQVLNFLFDTKTKGALCQIFWGRDDIVKSVLTQAVSRPSVLLLALYLLALMFPDAFTQRICCLRCSTKVVVYVWHIVGNDGMSCKHRQLDCRASRMPAFECALH